jgi:hypothetical protein
VGHKLGSPQTAPDNLHPNEEPPQSDLANHRVICDGRTSNNDWDGKNQRQWRYVQHVPSDDAEVDDLLVNPAHRVDRVFFSVVSHISLLQPRRATATAMEQGLPLLCVVSIFQRRKRRIVVANSWGKATRGDLFERYVDCGIVRVMSHCFGCSVVGNGLVALPGEAFMKRFSGREWHWQRSP